MLHKYAPAVFLLIAATFLLLPLTTSQAATDAGVDEAVPAKIERGRYLTTIAGCNDCHTPFHMTENGPAPDMSRMLSGHPQEFILSPAPTLPEGPWIGTFVGTNTAWAGPWGVSFTANLTPDAETGIGSWTEEEFIGAMRSGRHRGRGRQILPPMPWPNLAQAGDEDLSAIFAYLQQVPAISNRVPDPMPPTAPAH
jgi:hypothetical protein